MKALLCILAATILTSFGARPMNDDLDGYWMGYYLTKEKMIIKLNDNQRMEYYTGGIDDRTRVEGSYKISGDSVLITYQSFDGESVVMQGHYHRRRNCIEGSCKTNDKPSGKFYMEKQLLQERMVKP